MSTYVWRPDKERPDLSMDYWKIDKYGNEALIAFTWRKTHGMYSVSIYPYLGEGADKTNIHKTECQTLEAAQFYIEMYAS